MSTGVLLEMDMQDKDTEAGPARTPALIIMSLDGQVGRRVAWWKEKESVCSVERRDIKPSTPVGERAVKKRTALR